MNTKDRISELIQKYYQGESSDEEEKLLKVLLKEDNSTNYFPEKQLFGFYETQNNKSELNDSFELKLLNTISKIEMQKKKLNFIFFRKYKFYLSSAAALFLIAVSGYLFFGKSLDNQGTVITNKNFIENKTIAVQETQKVFQLISKNMNKANSNLKKLQYINKYSDSQHINN